MTTTARILEREQLISELSAIVSKTTNYGYGGHDSLRIALLEAVTNQHRTLQQDFFRQLKAFISDYGELDARAFTDARNEAAHEWCRRVSGDSDKPAHLVGLPFI